MKSEKKILAAPYAVWAAIFIIVPLCMILYYGLTDKNGAFTLENILAIAAPGHARALRRSVMLSLISTVICFLLAYPLAMILSEKKKNNSSFIILIFILPMWMNFLLRTYAWMTILEKNGLINRFLAQFGIGPLEMINTQGAVVLGMVYNYLPFMILPLYSVMTKIPNALIEAAQDLGCNGVQVLIRVLLPLTLPGISTGIIQVFVPSVSTFIISRMLGGGGNLLIGDLIDLQFLGNAYNPNLGAAISLVLMVMILLCMSITNQFGDEEKGEMLK